MIVKFGLRPLDPNTGRPGHPDAPGESVSSVSDAQNEDGSYVVGYIVGTDTEEVRQHLFERSGEMTSHLPGNEAMLDVLKSVEPYLAAGDTPDWVTVDAQQRNETSASDFERFLSEFYRCSRDRPVDVEATHYTLHPDAIYPPGQSPVTTEV